MKETTKVKHKKKASKQNLPLKKHLCNAQNYAEQDNYSEVINTLEPFLVQTLDQEDRVAVLTELIEAYADLGELDQVLEFAPEVLKFYEKTGNEIGQAKAHQCLSMAYSELGMASLGLNHALKSRELLKQKDRPLAKSMFLIGRAYFRAQDLENALTYCNAALTSVSEEKNVILEARILTLVAVLEGYAQKFDDAIAFQKQALDLFKAKKVWHRAAMLCNNIGASYYLIDDKETALRYYHEAQNYLDEVPHPKTLAWILYNIAEVLLDNAKSQKDFEEVEGYLLQTVELLKETSAKRELAETYKQLSTLYEKKEEPNKALESYKHYANLKVERLENEKKHNIKALELSYELERSQKEQEIYRLKNVELAGLVEQLEVLSSKDALSGLYNRRFLEEELARLVKEAQENTACLSIIMVDSDHFKQINDGFSHAVGDEVIRVVAKVFTEGVRMIDIVARYGGEEFVIVLPGMNLAQGRKIADRLRLEIMAFDWQEIHLIGKRFIQV